MMHPCEEEGCSFHHMGMAAFFGITLHSLIDGLALGAGRRDSEHLSTAVTARDRAAQVAGFALARGDPAPLRVPAGPHPRDDPRSSRSPRRSGRGTVVLLAAGPLRGQAAALAAVGVLRRHVPRDRDGGSPPAGSLGPGGEIPQPLRAVRRDSHHDAGRGSARPAVLSSGISRIPRRVPDVTPCSYSHRGHLRRLDRFRARVRLTRRGLVGEPPPRPLRRRRVSSRRARSARQPPGARRPAGRAPGQPRELPARLRRPALRPHVQPAERAEWHHRRGQHGGRPSSRRSTGSPPSIWI